MARHVEEPDLAMAALREASLGDGGARRSWIRLRRARGGRWQWQGLSEQAGSTVGSHLCSPCSVAPSPPSLSLLGPLAASDPAMWP
jgi:predicted N-acetyltransferase YhbS